MVQKSGDIVCVQRSQRASSSSQLLFVERDALGSDTIGSNTIIREFTILCVIRHFAGPRGGPILRRYRHRSGMKMMDLLTLCFIRMYTVVLTVRLRRRVEFLEVAARFFFHVVRNRQGIFGA